MDRPNGCDGHRRNISERQTNWQRPAPRSIADLDPSRGVDSADADRLADQGREPVCLTPCADSGGWPHAVAAAGPPSGRPGRSSAGHDRNRCKRKTGRHSRGRDRGVFGEKFPTRSFSP